MPQDPEIVLQFLQEVEERAEEVLTDKQQIVYLDLKRNQNREALRALQREAAETDMLMVCFGNMFIQFPKTKIRDMIQIDQEYLDEETARLQTELKIKVNFLYEAQGKPELKGFRLTPLRPEEMRAVQQDRQLI
uniref:P53 and DNA damage-regulated protein 1 isoform X1 n=1 Tax=Geotrypetes seraphini TaxID=260995 RepID=A0A6P8SJY6_GEOSA|nr:p53 and DNA damage-regulated protein 1 isoform X1 [Geotrypetes seraphini]XP_033819145.1 p53 and DNA damage-regulated protein 1 isoform X1 [Geotrypetes seraphini]XP_033819146.1 p53 and DNA damage-regulated protein 1 isoform X1 [Geotrypetes seraphini]XP_033819147.1 p53 and DNA damage-regulated protein 1 isoform X1 [Geotrypetes seraphini]XP_033819148.1 p53 and DNA damage-regulated protein 1 isoform X1 [Geotrypetes seraphini]XP_033819149.1 p53 and DNA damage-regulated protein 1 isoform X1 [Geot